MSSKQQTLRHSVDCTGIGLHTGKPVSLRLHPAGADTGVVFRRLDVEAGKGTIPARYDLVADTMLGTQLRNDAGVTLSTVEHLMAALWGCGIDNALIEVDGPEIPIMDGSSEPFVFLIECAGTVQQEAPRRYIRIRREVEVELGGSRLAVRPYDHFVLDIEIDFPHPAIARQRTSYDFSDTSFRKSLSRARTFGFAHEVDKLREMGLARGGSLDNAIVIDEQGVMNREGLRYTDEFLRHKALDCVGDFFLAGHMLVGEVEAYRPGHGINNALLRAVFADSANWELVSGATAAHRPVPVAVAAESAFAAA